MNVSKWSYLFLFLGLFGLLLINLFGNISMDDNQMYHLLKNTSKQAMIDAVDLTAYRVGIGYDGITSDTDPDSMHCISGKQGLIRIDECPPKIKVTITANENLSWFAKIFGKKQKTINYETDTKEAVNVLNAILESRD